MSKKKAEKNHVLMSEHVVSNLAPFWWYDFGWTRVQADAKMMTEGAANKLLAVILADRLLRVMVRDYKNPVVKEMKGNRE